MIPITRYSYSEICVALLAAQAPAKGAGVVGRVVGGSRARLPKPPRQDRDWQSPDLPLLQADWNYLGLVDGYRLRHCHSFHRGLLVTHGAPVAQSPMQPASVVEALRVLEDGAPRYLPISRKRRRCTGSVFRVAMKLSARHRVGVRGGSAPPHRGDDADLREALAERDRRLPDAAIRMVHDERPADGLRLHTAIPRASTTSPVLLMWEESIGRPTILLEWVPER